MPRFRPAAGTAVSAGGSTLDAVRRIIADVMHPGHFFTGGGLSLEWQCTTEEIAWEVFQGRLLEPAHTRQRRRFEAWNVFQIDSGARSDEPLLAVKLDVDEQTVSVVRGIHCYAWEGYDAGGGVYLSREARKWLRELVGVISLADFGAADDLRDELICRIFQAVAGTSRLPITSLEAPLPAFSLGQLSYFHHPAINHATSGLPMRSPSELLARGLGGHLNSVEQAKLLETLLRSAAAAELGRATDLFLERWHALGQPDGRIIDLLQTLFNEVSLSPYTALVDGTLAFLRRLQETGRVSAAGAIDFLGGLLRQLGRHLSAYDLVYFHHQGANYPDALLLDALLKAYLDLAERHPAIFEGDEPAIRLRRRGLRQGWLLRCRYEGHLVPDSPTSSGENARILPAPHVRVPEEQILQPHRRQRRLFSDAPMQLGEHGRAILGRSLTDLHQPRELWELGTALFLDRPFGAGKPRLAPDQTLLLSYVAFSPFLAERRLKDLADRLGLLSASEHDTLRRSLREGPNPRGIPIPQRSDAARPGVVSLADARQAADDFLLLHSTTRSVRDFLALYDLDALARRFGIDWLAAGKRLLIVAEAAPPGEGRVAIHDGELRRRLLLGFGLQEGYASRGGFEYPRGGLQLLRIWEMGEENSLRERDLSDEKLVLHAR